MTNPTNSEDVKAAVEYMTALRHQIGSGRRFAEIAPSGRGARLGEYLAANIEIILAAFTAAEQARDEAREALKPFAAVDMVNHGDAALIGIMRGVTSRNMATWSAHGLTVGDFRRAAKIINPAKEG